MPFSNLLTKSVYAYIIYTYCFTIVFLDGMCNYKGKMYQTGEKWTDGCDYECVCRDGNKGDYQCYNR